MSSRTNKQDFLSFARRVKFIVKRMNQKMWQSPSGSTQREKFNEMADLAESLQNKLREYYGPKIAAELEWEEGEL